MKDITKWVRDFDIVIQAGHENTPDGATGGESEWGKEIEWTPIVANEAVRILTEAGVSTKKLDASIKSGTVGWVCKLAVFVHFDDPDDGSSGPSVGYPVDHGNDLAAGDWKTLYKRYWPFAGTWHGDNFTADERGYYGFRYTKTTDAEFLIELGDISSQEQALWMKPRLKWLGSLLAHYLSKRSGLGGVPDPGEFVDPSEKKTVPEDFEFAGSYKMPKYALAEFGTAAGVPWGLAQPLSELNWYSGLVADSAYSFSEAPVPALYYESKYAIDADGSSGDAEDDPDGQTDTSLHTADGVALNSRHYPFIVLPLEPKTGKRTTLQGCGVKLGDLGVVIYKTGKVVPVLYGDFGPAVKIGEGSMGVATQLGMSSSPSQGGIGASEVPPGVVHLVFPGTTDVSNGKTRRTAADIAADAMALFNQFRREDT